ncbi:hypothetical protein ACFL6F_00785 [Planctomycetota bacterium]
MNRCTRCLMPENKLNVTLDQNDTCNYCTYFDTHDMVHPEHTDRKSMLTKKLQAYKGEYEHDVLIGLSGGKDSTYVAYRLVQDYGVKVQALTYENGFLTDHARENIDRIVEKLGLDHFYYKPDWDLHRLLYKAAFEKLGDPCIACGFAGYLLSIKLCYELNIPFFVHGRSPYQMFRNYYEGSRDVFIHMNQANLKQNTFKDTALLYRQVYQHVLQSLDLLIENPEEREHIRQEFFLDPGCLNKEFAPEFVGFFLFEPYNEETMRSVLEKGEIGKPQKTHSDCLIHETAVHVFREIQGISLETAEVAAMLRFGAVSKDEAEAMLSDNNADEDSLKKSNEVFCKRLGISQTEFEDHLNVLKQHDILKFGSH